MQDRAQIVHQNFLRRITEGDLPPASSYISSELSFDHAVQIFESQCTSRQLDNIARDLQSRGEGFYTIGSAGHEGNAAIAAALRVTDMAFLHYRDAAFFIQRSKQLSGQTPLWDMLLSFTASAEDPISGGRHKVLGSKELNIPPQTSTIGSHPPKAIGAAYSLALNKKLGQDSVIPTDSIIACSFGDASLNHSTTQGALNTAGWTSYQSVALPLLFICEDNGLGISVPTPQNWVKQSMQNRAGLKYFACNGLDIFETFKVAKEAETYVRANKKPAFLHMSCVRFFGHAGPDAQHIYMSKRQIEETERHDPLLYSASSLITSGTLSKDDVLDIYLSIRERLGRASEHVIKRPKLETAQEVMAPIIPPKKEIEAVEVKSEKRDGKHHLAKALNFALDDLMNSYGNIVLAGEDIGRKGGVYTITSGLYKKYGAHRVIDTILDEQSILGLGIGMAHNNILPIPEIQFLAYLHNAEDQIRGEAATLSFFSKGQYTNPMVIRIAGLGYQRGFGGHFHNDNALSILRDIPGLILCCPSNASDAPALLKECVRLAHEEQRIVVFLEPITLYMTKDLHTPKDNAWCFDYDIYPKISMGDIGQFGNGKDLAIISFGNGYYHARQAAKILEDTHNINLCVIDLRWLTPLPEDALLKVAQECEHILIVDETRKSGGVSESLMTLLKDHPKTKRLAAEDSFIPLGRAYDATLPTKDKIIEHALELVKAK